MFFTTIDAARLPPMAHVERRRRQRKRRQDKRQRQNYFVDVPNPITSTPKKRRHKLVRDDSFGLSPIRRDPSLLEPTWSIRDQPTMDSLRRIFGVPLSDTLEDEDEPLPYFDEEEERMRFEKEFQRLLYENTFDPESGKVVYRIRRPEPSRDISSRAYRDVIKKPAYPPHQDVRFDHATQRYVWSDRRPNVPSGNREKNPPQSVTRVNRKPNRPYLDITYDPVAKKYVYR